MRNDELAEDYVRRAGVRLRAVDVLFDSESWAELRRDRELAVYGAEDLTPSGFYSREDGERARSGARRVVEIVTRCLP